MLVDYAKITIKSGKGGDGHVSFRRELFVPDGGPDGGDGGRGGDIIFEVDKGMNTLAPFKHKRKYAATDGQEGGKRRCHGANGENLVIKVPEGTVVKEAETGKVVADMSGDNTREIILEGGKGGTGNMHYATSVMQAPKYAKPGKPGRELEVILELKSIADVGLIGYPNVGKSTFLSMTTNANPKIANYHFTTISPNLGVVDYPGVDSFVIADIPGLIEGASAGVGLGHYFLRHIERTKLLVHVIDLSGCEGRDPGEDYKNIMHELETYSKSLCDLPQIVAANKTDIMLEEDIPVAIDMLKEAIDNESIKIIPISAATGDGIKELLYEIDSLRKTLPDKLITFEKEFEFGDEIEELPYDIVIDKDGAYVVEGPLIDKMLGYTNLESERGFAFFQKFIKERGINDKLHEMGINEGDTVRMYGHEFEFFDED